MEKEFIVGKKYFVPKENMKRFKMLCHAKFIYPETLNVLDKPTKLLEAYGLVSSGSMILYFGEHCHWRFPPEAIALIKLYEEYVQEEMEL